MAGFPGLLQLDISFFGGIVSSPPKNALTDIVPCDCVREEHTETGELIDQYVNSRRPTSGITTVSTTPRIQSLKIEPARLGVSNGGRNRKLIN